MSDHKESGKGFIRKLSKPPGGYADEDIRRRSEWLKAHRSSYSSDIVFPSVPDLEGILEYPVGFVPVPMAVASPLCITSSSYAKGEYIVPLCTLEGALVMSMCRGMLATSLCDGIQTCHVQQEVNRSPAFLMETIAQRVEFQKFLDSHYEQIKQAADSTTRYGKLLRIEFHTIHRWIVLDMIYSTGNAAGQNMVTIATNAACRYITTHFPCTHLLESGFNGDKKPSRRNLVKGRGHFVTAEATISHKVLRRVLHISSQDAYLLHSASLPVAHLSGTLGNHLHIANTLAAIYIATGQDAACVGENAIGHTQVDVGDYGLRINVTLPSITVGIVGGGTRLPMQRKNLELLGCSEGENASCKLAEIICASTLAIELSLLSSISSGTFAEAHEIYGRRSTS